MIFTKAVVPLLLLLVLSIFSNYTDVVTGFTITTSTTSRLPNRQFFLSSIRIVQQQQQRKQSVYHRWSTRTKAIQATTTDKNDVTAATVEVNATTTTTTTTSSNSTTSKRRYNIDGDIGIIEPTGFWDPLYLSDNIDSETYEQYRIAEIKHGRVAMLCVVGYIVPEIYKFPFDIAPGLSCQSIPNGVAAIDAIPSLGWIQIIFFIGAVDYYGYFGNYSIGMGSTIIKSSDILFQREQSEITHGRLAMLASLELLRHDAQNYIFPNYDGLGDHLITGLPFLYTTSTTN